MNKKFVKLQHNHIFFLNAFLCLFSIQASLFIIDPLQMNMKNIQM